MDYILINNQIEYTHHEGILSYSKSELWGSNVQGKDCLVYEDFGDGVNISFLDPSTDRGRMIKLNYSELQQLAVMISLHDPCEYTLSHSALPVSASSS
jgi:hypothetical protein